MSKIYDLFFDKQLFRIAFSFVPLILLSSCVNQTQKKRDNVSSKARMFVKKNKVISKKYVIELVDKYHKKNKSMIEQFDSTVNNDSCINLSPCEVLTIADSLVALAYGAKYLCRSGVNLKMLNESHKWFENFIERIEKINGNSEAKITREKMLSIAKVLKRYCEQQLARLDDFIRDPKSLGHSLVCKAKDDVEVSCALRAIEEISCTFFEGNKCCLSENEKNEISSKLIELFGDYIVEYFAEYIRQWKKTSINNINIEMRLDDWPPITMYLSINNLLIIKPKQMD